MYKYGRHKIVVYSSFFFHRLFVDDKLCDENNTFVYYVDIVLDDNIETIAGDKTSRVKIVATINLFNRIKLKIDGKLQIPEM